MKIGCVLTAAIGEAWTTGLICCLSVLLRSKIIVTCEVCK